MSVIIRARDEAAAIGRTLALLAAQHRRPDEVIVVDSDSQDETGAIAARAGARVIAIPAAGFSFGGALNTGCAQASGEILVALSAHAFPTDQRWLGRMVASFDDARVACATGAPHDPAGAPLRAAVRQDAAGARWNWAWGYSNAAGGFRAELWRQRRFREDMPASEDKEWALHWLDRGYVSLVDPALAVEHDHSRDPLAEQFRRSRIEAIGFSMFADHGPERGGELIREWWSPPGLRSGAWRARISPRRVARLAGRAAAARAIQREGRVRKGGLRLGLITDLFPVASQTFIANEIDELTRQGHRVLVEASHRPAGAGAARPAHWLEDDTGAGRWAALAALAARHPVAALRDRRAQPRWRREEKVRPLRAIAPRARRLRRAGASHLHVHFAASAALDAMRIAAIEGIPYSVTAHAYEIFEAPQNLGEKLERAAFATTGCEYNRRHLRSLVGAEAGGRIHVVLMGVDTEAFRRSTPYPGGRHVVAIGRLVEKKGFADLIDAAAALEEERRLDRVTIVGEGPLRAQLAAQIERLGLGGRVELAGERAPEQVREILERADLLAMPCVVAANGDRDSMPVVVKEAMAMEVPVVGSDEVGLPELIGPEFGRLAPAGDGAALAEAIAGLLDLPPSRRAEMGRAGRRHAIERCSLARETARLVELFEAAAAGRAGTTRSSRHWSR